MKTLVLGGGVVGVTTAYFLARAGHEVTVVEEKDALGLEATGGNAGIIAPGHSFAWASPRAPRMLWQSLRGAETAIRVRLTPDLRLYTWGLRFLRECTAERARRNTLDQAAALPVQPGDPERAGPSRGHRVSRDQRRARSISIAIRPSWRRGSKKMALLAERGQKQEILDARAVARLDPVFEPVQHKIAGAIRDVGDSSGDSRLFVENLARVCRDKLGVIVRLGTRVTALRADGDRIDGVLTSDGVMTADSYVLALGVGAPRVAQTAGVGLPIYPAKGYSSTLPAEAGRIGADGRRASTSSGSSAGRGSATGCVSRRRRSSPATTGAGRRATSTTSCGSPAISSPTPPTTTADEYRACLQADDARRTAHPRASAATATSS